MESLSFKQYYSQKLDVFETYLKTSFPSIPPQVAILEESMRYSLMAGGKRLRPILMLTVVEAAGLESQFALPYAAALEYIHTYSLIHDDLPCMDDDELRRGVPTNHIRFGEAVALLAGDALLTHSFCLLSQPQSAAVSAETQLKIINVLANLAGVFGMVSGQVADMIPPLETQPEDRLLFIHAHKTGALITASVQIGMLLANLDHSTYELMTRFGEELGKCFQIQDDILDETGDKEIMGKTPGSDARNETLTYPSVYGLEASYTLANECYENALSYLEQTGLDVSRLKDLAGFVLKRDH